MNTTFVKVKKLTDKAILPAYGTEYSAGADLYACLDADELVIPSGETAFIHTGVALEIPDGLVGLVYARSGIASKQGLAPANKVGVVDSDYRGEIIVSLHNHSSVIQSVKDGERIAQIVFAPYYVAKFEEADDLSDTKRGEGGFGSTGRK